MADDFTSTPYVYPQGSFYEDLDVRLRMLETILGTSVGTIADGAITEFKLADNAVTDRSLRDGTVTQAKLNSLLVQALLFKTGGTLTGNIDLGGNTLLNAIIDPFACVPIGGFVSYDMGEGLAAPPTNKAYRYVDLTAGLTGSGGYNEGILTSEVVGGTAPLITATAVVSLAGSPLKDLTIRLLNSEGRIVRPSTTPGSTQDDAIQNITGTFNANHTSGGSATGAFTVTSISSQRETSGSNNGIQVAFNASRVVRTSTETRMRNVGVKLYRRIK